MAIIFVNPTTRDIVRAFLPALKEYLSNPDVRTMLALAGKRVDFKEIEKLENYAKC